MVGFGGFLSWAAALLLLGFQAQAACDSSRIDAARTAAHAACDVAALTELTPGDTVVPASARVRPLPRRGFATGRFYPRPWVPPACFFPPPPFFSWTHPERKRPS
jgi:hypothetical protein